MPPWRWEQQGPRYRLTEENRTSLVPSKPANPKGLVGRVGAPLPPKGMQPQERSARASPPQRAIPRQTRPGRGRSRRRGGAFTEPLVCQSLRQRTNREFSPVD
jgi:hypothetical protein